MSSEPDWSKSISGATVCTWFYILALLNGIIAAAGVVGLLMLLTNGSKSLAALAPLATGGIIGFINAWALFLVCSRGISN
jgi:hypothetical protein